MRTNVQSTLRYLDSMVPKGSHVLLMGLPDGRILYDTMASLTHPLGVTYRTLYDYLNCLSISPCYVWLNSNSSVRDAGSERAAQLSEVLKQEASVQNYSSFTIDYMDCPIEKALKKYSGPTSDLIEPVDGFHPAQKTMPLIAEVSRTLTL